ncbi:MAG: phosphatidylglycerophosphatase A [Deltaproteobacteria bacterium]|nr:phosphatidylglycerophosphatase A [Deltaproteobacteria bacterium]
MSETDPVSLTDKIAKAVWTVGGLGELPMAPGTWGAVGAVPIYLVLWKFGNWKIYLIVLLAVFFGGWLVSHRANIFYKKHDDSRVVIDEAAGYLTTMFLAPQDAFLPLAPLWGFALFRLFDIWKPGLLKKVDRTEGGLFVMLDDVLAGLLACAAMWVVAALLALFKNPFLPQMFVQ